MRKLHKWLGLIVVIQLLLWCVSGTVFAWLDHHEVTAEHTSHAPTSGSLSRAISLAEPARWLDQYTATEVYEVRLTTLLDDMVWRVETANGAHLHSAADGSKITLDDEFARRLAVAHYAGDGQLGAVEFQPTSGLETRGEAAVWKVQFNDEGQTALYFAADDGRLVATRNSTWRLFDFFWMLHTMDYQGRDNFNNPLVITVGTATLWLSLSGLLLLFRSFRRQDFDLVGAWRRRGAPVRVVNSQTGEQTDLNLDATRNLYLALEGAGIELPSNCGGGGTCGLCTVTFRTSAPVPVNEERALLPASALAAGVRLACRHYGVERASVEVSEAALLSRRREMVVAAERFLTPYIKELTLRPLTGGPFQFRAGSYVQVDVPAGEISLDALTVPAQFAADWTSLKTRRPPAPQAVVRRAYSMANAPNEIGDQLKLNVRFAPAATEDVPSGVGATYLFTRRVGDRVLVRGAFGTFCDSGRQREKVFIGGGAGMAPLRSIIVDSLRNQRSRATISYWYGARSRRELFYTEELERLAHDFSNFTWHVALSDATAADGWDGLTGYIHNVVRQQYLDAHSEPRACEYYLCGPPAMLTACRNMLAALGVSEDQIFFDDFGI